MAATWAEKTDAEQQVEQTRQLREKVQKLHDDAGKEDGKGLSAKELDAKGNAQLQLSQDGHLATGVPGAVAGMFAALKYAKLARTLAPNNSNKDEVDKMIQDLNAGKDIN